MRERGCWSKAGCRPRERDWQQQGAPYTPGNGFMSGAGAAGNIHMRKIENLAQRSESSVPGTAGSYKSEAAQKRGKQELGV